MNSPTARAPCATWAASLITDEQSAPRIAALVAESFPAEELAVSFVDAGHRQWRVPIHFRAAPDENAVRALVAAAAGAAAGRALRFERVAAKNWVRGSLGRLQTGAARR